MSEQLASAYEEQYARIEQWFLIRKIKKNGLSGVLIVNSYGRVKKI